MQFYFRWETRPEISAMMYWMSSVIRWWVKLIKIVYLLKERNPRDSAMTHDGPDWERAALTRSDEDRIHLRCLTDSDLNTAALDESLRFRHGLGAKNSCKVEDTQRRRAPCSLQIESDWMKGNILRQARHY
jgi:hypothetical protein